MFLDIKRTTSSNKQSQTYKKDNQSQQFPTHKLHAQWQLLMTKCWHERFARPHHFSQGPLAEGISFSGRKHPKGALPRQPHHQPSHHSSAKGSFYSK